MGKKNLHSGRSFASDVGVHLFQEVNMPYASERLAPAKQIHFDIYRKSSEDSPWSLHSCRNKFFATQPIPRGVFHPILLGTFCGNSLSTPLNRSNAFSRGEDSGRFPKGFLTVDTVMKLDLPITRHLWTSMMATKNLGVLLFGQIKESWRTTHLSRIIYLPIMY